MAFPGIGGWVNVYYVLMLTFILTSLPFSSSLYIPGDTPSDTLIDEEDNGGLPSSGPLIRPIIGSGFTENRGQIDDEDVLFYATATEREIAFLMSEVRILLVEPMNPTDTAKVGSCIQLTFPGSNAVKPEGRILEKVRHSVFLGTDRAGWQSDIGCYQEIVYRDLFEGVDLIYKTNGGGLKYEFHLKPYIDPSVVRVRVQGHEGLQVDWEGNLVISTEAGDLRDEGLEVFYRDDPSEEVPGSFKLDSADTYRFDLGPHDEERGLVIDPVIFSTFIGAGKLEYCDGVATDDDMNVYLTGLTFSPQFPKTPGAFNDSVDNSSNVFVCKLNRQGSLVFSALIGGSYTDEGTDIVVDSEGNVYVVGRTTSWDFPVTDGSISSNYSGDFDVFVFKLGPNGSALVFSTYLGGMHNDAAEGVAIDGEGNLLVVGSTGSVEFPTTEGAFQESSGGVSDAFICKMPSNGSSLLYSTFLGGAGHDHALDIVIDQNNSAIVVGDSSSTDFPVTAGAFDRWMDWDDTDGFVCKLDPDGSSLNFSTYLGEYGKDECYGVVLSPGGEIIIAGTTYSHSSFKTTPDAYQPSFGGGYSDGIVCMLNFNGSLLLYSTFFGGNSTDYVYDIGLSQMGCFYLMGSTISGDLNTTSDAMKPRKGGKFDAFFVKFDPVGGEILYSTYVGGAEADIGSCLAVAGSEIVFITGTTRSWNLQTTPGAIQRKLLGPADAYVVGFNTDISPPVAEAGPDRVVSQHQPMRLNGSYSRDNVAVVNWTWRFTIDQWTVELFGPEPEFTFHIPGVYIVRLDLLDAAGNRASDIAHVVVPDAGTDIVTTVGSRVWFDAFGFSAPLDTIDWSWTFSYHGERKDIEGPVFNFIFERTGAFQVALCVTDSLGNRVDDGFTVTVLTEDGSLADAGPDITVDQFVPLHLEAFDQMEGIMVCTWRILYNGSWVEMTGSDPNITFHVVGTYEANLWMRDTNGGPHSDTMTITVIDREQPVAFAGTDLVVDQFTTVEFDGSASNDNVGIVEWVFSYVYDERVVYLYDARANFTFDIPGEYEVSLTVADAIGNNGEDLFNLIVLDITLPVAFAGSGQMVDQHTTVFFDGGSSSDNVGVVNWTWNFSYAGSEVTLFGAYPTFFFDDAGSYPVTLTVRDQAGLNDTDVITIVVMDTASPVAFAGEDMVVTAGDAVSFNGSNSTDNVGIINYTWTFDYRGSPITLYGEAPEFMFERVGEYLVTIVVLDSELHSSSDSLLVVVEERERTSSGDHRVTLAVALVVVVATLGFLGCRWSRRGSK